MFRRSDARARAALALALLGAVLACSRALETPEARVREVLAALEAGAEARDAGAMKEHVSEGYRDAQGQDKREAAALAAFHFLRNQSVYLLTRVRSVEVEAPGEARAEVVVAMAGAPIPSPEALVGLRADLYQFSLRLREEDGAWRVSWASWHPAELDDFR
jgi:hypothetical protein